MIDERKLRPTGPNFTPLWLPLPPSTFPFHFPPFHFFASLLSSPTLLFLSCFSHLNRLTSTRAHSRHIFLSSLPQPPRPPQVSTNAFLSFCFPSAARGKVQMRSLPRL